MYFFIFQYVVPDTSKNSLWKQFWDHFRTDDEGNKVLITVLLIII